MTAYWQADSADVSVNAVCQLAGVAKPSLYRDFGSEDGLTRAVLERYSEVVLEKMDGVLSSDASFAAKLDAMVYFASEEPQMEAGCLFVKMRSSRSRFGEQTQALITALETHTLGLFARFFGEGRARGEWAGGVPAELAARYLHEQLGLALAQRAAGRSRESVRPLLSLALSVLLQTPERR